MTDYTKIYASAAEAMRTIMNSPDMDERVSMVHTPPPKYTYRKATEQDRATMSGWDSQPLGWCIVRPNGTLAHARYRAAGRSGRSRVQREC